MNIGIIVYSQTGNTLSVANRIQESCAAAGHTAEVKQITVQELPKSASRVVLKDIPTVDGYDAVIFGAPVQAFSLCAQMKAYLQQLPDLAGLSVACYATQGLPYKWMGGNRAHRTMNALLTAKGATPMHIGHVHWKSPERNMQVAAVVSSALKFAVTAKA